MADAEVTRVIAAPLRQVVKALDRLNVKDGNPNAQWNATKTVIRDVSSDGTIEMALAPVDAANTAVTISITANDPRMSQMLQLMGTQLLDQAMDEITQEINRELGSGDLDL